MTDGYARRALGGTAQAGEPEDGHGRHLEGVAVPWDAEAVGTVEYGDLAERFDRHAFDGVIAQGRRVPVLDRHDGTVVGMAELYAGDAGLMFRGDLIPDDPQADAFARRVAAGADGVSIEFRPGRVRRGSRSLTHLAVDRVAAIAGAYAPALVGASVAVRRATDMVDMTLETTEETPPQEPVDAVTRTEVEGLVARQVADLRRLIREGGTPTEVQGLVFRSLDEAWRQVDAHRADTDHRTWYARALADITTGDAPGVMGVGGTVRGIVEPGRPAITAFGTAPLGDNGMSVDWPTYSGTLSGLIGKQTAEKTEITSAKVPITKASAAIETYAGGADISYQLLRRSSPSYLDAWTRIMLAAYATITDQAFVQDLEAQGTGSGTWDPATADEAATRAAIFAASVAVQDATGRPAEFVLAGASAFGAIGGALVPVNPTNANGTANAATLAPVLSGLPVRYDPHIADATAIVSNRLAAAWCEEGPFQASEEDVAKLGRNVAYWGMGVGAIYLPAGIVTLSAGGLPRTRQSKRD